MRKKCKDCDNPVATNASIRCFDCKLLLRKETQRINKLKYTYHKKPKARYEVYKRGALSRGYSFELTLEEFSSFWNTECGYCNTMLEGIGLDRKDNTKGYELSNVISCCSTCNFMKGKLTHDEFIDKCAQISKCFTTGQSRLKY